MAKYTPTQIAMVAWNAGIHDEPTMARAVAIALAESDGNTAAHNTNASTGDNSYGLWQINMIGSMGPARRAQFDIASNDALFDAEQNGKAMWILSNHGKNWSPWSTFKSGAYMKHIPTGKAVAKDIVNRSGLSLPSNPLGWIWKNIGATNAAIGEGVGNAVGGVASTLDIGGAISAAFNSFGKNMMKMGVNLGAVILAAILIILGIIIMLREPLKKAASVAVGIGENVAPGGKIATKVAKFSAQRAANSATRSGAAATRTAATAKHTAAAAKLTRAQAAATRAQVAATKAQAAAAKVAKK